MILEYAAEHYPEAQFIEAHYNTVRFFVWNNFRDGISFELKGVEFNIIAEYGKILADGYPRARAEDQLKKIIYNDFLTPQNINANCTIDFFSGSEPTEDIFTFDGIVYIDIQIKMQNEDLRSDEWLYDFYVFFRDSIKPLRYNVSICIFDERIPNTQKRYIEFNSKTDYIDKSEFYSTIL